MENNIEDVLIWV